MLSLSCGEKSNEIFSDETAELKFVLVCLDARFNKKLIENCHLDIQRHCREEFQLTDDDGNDSDEKDDDDDENEAEQNNVEQVNEDLIDREMGGRIIGCLRKTYVDTSSVLESNCVSELVEVIQTSKLDVRLDIQLYRACKSFLGSECIGKDQEDCLKLQFQKGKIQDENCRNEIKRIIREGKADVHIDRALTFACHADLLKYCNDIPLGKTESFPPSSKMNFSFLFFRQRKTTPMFNWRFEIRHESMSTNFISTPRTLEFGKEKAEKIDTRKNSFLSLFDAFRFPI